MAWEFKRNVEDSLIEELKKSELWKEKLKADCEKGEVFLAIRNGYISFYHKGGSLFKFDKSGFSTHIKYASVIDTDDEDAETNYIHQDKLGNMKVISDFVTGYERIKKNCEHYSGVEAEGVSKFYHTCPYIKTKSIVILDIEVAFKNEDVNKPKSKKQDRIDILLYDKVSKTLRFVEAKHFSNDELKSKTKPRVVGQIEKYEAQIIQHEGELKEQYGLYINVLNKIFDEKYDTTINTVIHKVTLFIFGFDEAQRKGDQFKNMIKAIKNENVPICQIGGPDGKEIESIWNAK